MRLDALPPRTALIGVVAAWALCVWLLGLFGLGGQISRLPDDPSLRRRLPQPVQPAPERLGPPQQYAEIGARPLFSEDRRPQPFFINPEEGEAENTFDYVLTSVLITPRVSMAIIEPTGGGDPVRVKVGAAPDDAPAWSLASVQPRSATFNGPEGERTLDLRVFDGQGGEAPTPVSAVPPAGAEGNAAARVPARTGGVARKPAPSVPQPVQPPPQAAPDPAAPLPVPPVEPSAEEQADAIRQRIEARRAQLREEAQQQAQPARNP